MKIRSMFVTVFAVMMTMLASSNAQALSLAWSGSGGSGSDPIGNNWQITNNGPGGASVWGIPGNGAGVVGFGPTSADGSFVKDFHIQFLALPTDVTIVPTATGSSSNLTTFFDNGSGQTWTRDIQSAGAVSFFAPVTGQVDKGESFFVNVVFSRALTTNEISSLSFNAQWTETGIVPEPATATLGIMGLAGLMLRRRRAA
jgi:hypothetical protein